MKVTKKSLPVMSSWLVENQNRLDASPFLSGAFEARIILERLKAKKEPLQTLTENGIKGIFNGPRFARTYVNDPEYGIPLLSGADMLQADFSNVSLLSKKQAKTMPQMILKEGTTIISSYGTIGRTAYCRSDMVGMVGSDNTLKVIPNQDKIQSGYLYAFLSSKFGVPLIVAGTSGAIITYLDPSRVADLPVPRLGAEIEGKVHDLIVEASRLRTEASKAIKKAKESFNWLLEGIDLSTTKQSPKTNIVLSKNICLRFEATYHNPISTEIEQRILSHKHTYIQDFCKQISLPGIFKRIYTEDENYGAPYYSGASMYWLEPVAKGILSTKTSLFKDVQIRKGTILVQAFGQVNGLIGRPTWVGKHLDGATTTHMMIRLKTHKPELAGYLYAYLDSFAGYTQIIRLPYGGSIPHFDEKNIANVPIPLLSEDEMFKISSIVLSAFDDRDKALDHEREAKFIVEKTIEKGAG